MLTIGVADSAYRKYGVISVCENGKVVKIEREVDRGEFRYLSMV